ncbi:MAG: sterol desaturase family protein [Chitinophagales bacterium]
MKSYGNMLLIAMPIFLALIIVEQLWGWFKHKEKPHLVDTISSIASGMTNILKSTLGLTIVIISYPWLLQHLSLIHWNLSSFWPYVITFIFFDFTGYWEHRLNHRVNFFWNHHIIHHSSEEYNLPCALRQQISVFTNLLTIVTLPLAVLGIPAEVLAVVGPIHLFAQFWYHTRYIGKLGFLEYFLVTPSHHRVHHAMNDVYMDKNYGQIFIFWDKWFGTFQEERENEIPIYGMRRPAGTWNPFFINFKHLFLLIKDSYRTRSIRDKFKVWLMPTGWRPSDVATSYPVFTLEKAEQVRKYRPSYSINFEMFSIIHGTVIFLLLCFLFSRFGEIGREEMLLYGLFLLMEIFGFTSFLDKKWYGWGMMLACALAGSFYVLYTGNWFGLNSILPYGNWMVGGYLIGSVTIAALLMRSLPNAILHSES